MKNLFLTFLLILSTQVFAQVPNIKLDVGEKEKKGLTAGNLGIIATTAEGFYALRIKSKGVMIGGIPIGAKGVLYLDYYDKNLNLKDEIKIEDISYTTVNKVKKALEFFVQDKQENIYIFYSTSEKDYTYLYRKKLNVRTNKFGKDELVSKNKSSKKNKMDRRGTYGAFTSPDKSKTAIVSFARLDKKSDDILYVEVINNIDLNTIWKKEFQLDISGFSKSAKNSYLKTVNSSQAYDNVYPIKLSNSGDLSFLFKVFDESTRGLFKQTEYDYKLFSATENGINNKTINSKSKYIVEATLKYDNNGNIKCAGFFSDDRKKVDYDGIVFYEYDKDDLSLIDKNIIAFSGTDKKNFLISSDDDRKRNERNEKRLNKKIKKGKDVGINTFYLRDIVTHADNSLTLISESYYVVVTKSVDKDGNVTYTYTYHFEDMVFIHLNDDGEMEWIKNVQKRQVGGNYGILGVKLFYAGDNMFFLYNNVVGKNGTLNIGVMDKKGNYENKELAELRKKSELKKMYISPVSFKKISKNEIVGFASKLFKSKIVKLTLDGIEFNEELKTMPVAKNKKPKVEKKKEEAIEKKKEEIAKTENKAASTKKSIAAIEKQYNKLKENEIEVDEFDNLNEAELQKQLKIIEFKERLEKVKALEKQLSEIE